MARLPQVGGDKGNWGTILNDYLSQAHNADGTLKPIPHTNVTGLGSAAAQDVNAFAAHSVQDTVETGRLSEDQLNAALAATREPRSLASTVPAGVGWPGSVSLSPSVSISRSGEVRGSVGVSPRGMFGRFSNALTSPDRVYYVSNAGSDTTGTGAVDAPFRSPRAAMTKMNTELTASQSAQILLDCTAGNDFSVQYGFEFGGILQPVCDFALLGVNGRPKFGPWLPLTIPTLNPGANLAPDPGAATPSNFSAGGQRVTLTAGPTLAGATSSTTARATVTTGTSSPRFNLGLNLGLSFPNAGQICRLRFKAKVSDVAMAFNVTVRRGSTLTSDAIFARDTVPAADTNVHEYVLDFTTFNNGSLTTTAGVYLSVSTASAVAGQTVDVTDISLQVLWTPGDPTANQAFPFDSTYTHCSIIPSTVITATPIRVLDKAQVDGDGLFGEIALAASLAACDATPGTWFYTANTLYVHRADGAAAMDDNLLITTHKTNIYLTAQVNSYFENIDFIGGRARAQVCSAITSGANTPKAMIGNNCTVSYSGGWYTPDGATSNLDSNGVAGNGHVGLIAFFDTRVVGTMADAYNVHRGDGNSAYWYALLTVNCSATGIGTNGNSRNGFTLHETCIGAAIACDFRRSHGGTIHNIGTSKFYGLEVLSADDAGDNFPPFAGTYPPTQFKASDSAQLYLERPLAAGPVGGLAYAATSPATIHLRDPYPTRLASSGTVSY